MSEVATAQGQDVAQSVMPTVTEGEIHVVPPIQTHNKLPIDVLRKQITDVLSYKIKDFARLKDAEYGREAVVICGGPTIDGLVDRLKQVCFGRVIVCIDRMQKWCWSHGIIPDYVVCMDGSGDFVADSFKECNPYTRYVFATQCGGVVANALKNAQAYILSSVHENLNPLVDANGKVTRETAEDGGPVLTQMYKDAGYHSYTTLNGGSNVALTAFLLTNTLGVKRFHVFGFDCHIQYGGYATGVTGGYPGVQHAPDSIFDAHVDGRVFKTTAAYWAGAQQFFVLMNYMFQAKTIDQVKVYGDSAVLALCNYDYKAFITGDVTVEPLSPEVQKMIDNQYLVRQLITTTNQINPMGNIHGSVVPKST